MKLALALVLLATIPGAAQAPAAATGTAQLAPSSLPPERWAPEMAVFEADDVRAPFSKGEIVFVGSSTIRQWNVAASFPDLKILNRGFGGSELADAVRNVDRLVIKHEPRLVVVYAGDNDIAAGRLSEQVAVEFERFVRLVHAKLPETRILYLAIKPSLLRWLNVDRMRLANEMIRAICSRDDRLAFLDFDSAMMGWDERPRRELFTDDGLHLSAQGYQLWSAIIRPLLLR